MRLSVPKCPTCGNLAVSIVEQILGDAIIDCDEYGNADYVGETDVCWDSQVRVIDEKTGLNIVQCDFNHEWLTEIIDEDEELS